VISIGGVLRSPSSTSVTHPAREQLGEGAVYSRVTPPNDYFNISNR
jgi:hypothetical protein